MDNTDSDSGKPDGIGSNADNQANRVQHDHPEDRVTNGSGPGGSVPPCPIGYAHNTNQNERAEWLIQHARKLEKDARRFRRQAKEIQAIPADEWEAMTKKYMETVDRMWAGIEGTGT